PDIILLLNQQSLNPIKEKKIQIQTKPVETKSSNSPIEKIEPIPKIIEETPVDQHEIQNQPNEPVSKIEEEQSPIQSTDSEKSPINDIKSDKLEKPNEEKDDKRSDVSEKDKDHVTMDEETFLNFLKKHTSSEFSLDLLGQIETESTQIIYQ